MSASRVSLGKTLRFEGALNGDCRPTAVAPVVAANPKRMRLTIEVRLMRILSKTEPQYADAVSEMRTRSSDTRYLMFPV